MYKKYIKFSVIFVTLFSCVINSVNAYENASGWNRYYIDDEGF